MKFTFAFVDLLLFDLTNYKPQISEWSMCDHVWTNLKDSKLYNIMKLIELKTNPRHL
jgi:hypothetical protein